MNGNIRLETFFMQHLLFFKFDFNFSRFLYAPFEPTNGFWVDEIHAVPLCVEKVLINSTWARSD